MKYAMFLFVLSIWTQSLDYRARNINDYGLSLWQEKQLKSNYGLGDSPFFNPIEPKLYRLDLGLYEIPM
jgi:hypothetical protein